MYHFYSRLVNRLNFKSPTRSMHEIPKPKTHFIKPMEARHKEVHILTLTSKNIFSYNFILVIQ